MVLTIVTQAKFCVCFNRAGLMICGFAKLTNFTYSYFDCKLSLLQSSRLILLSTLHYDIILYYIISILYYIILYYIILYKLY